MQKQSLLFFISCLFGYSFSQAQLPPFHLFNTSDGLISDMVYDIHQDQKGYLWFATEAGLSRFDGYQFTNFTSDDGLPVNEVLDLREDRKGRLWCMTFPGIPTYFENGQFVHSRNREWLKPAEVPVYFGGFLEDQQGHIWMIGSNSHVFRLDMNQQEILEFTPEKIGGYPTGIWQDKESNIWLLGKGKFFRWDGAGFDVVANFSHSRRMVLKTDPDGRALAGGEGGILEFRNGVHHIIIQDSILKNRFQNDLFEDSKGDLWVSTNSGLLRYRKSGDNWFLKDHLLKDVFVTRLIQDKEGNYWVSTLGKGVYFFPSFDLVSIRPDDPGNPSFFCLAVNEKGELLAGGNRIWGKVRGKKFVDTRLTGFGNNRGQVSQILTHPKGYTFVISPGGLLRIDPEGNETQHFVTSKSLGIGPDGSIFLASKAQVYQFQIDETLPKYFMRDSTFCNTHIPFSKRLFDLTRSPDQRYLAVDNDSLYFYNGETFQAARQKLPPGQRFLRKIHFDNTGDMWLLWEGKGILHFSGDSTYIIDQKVGLSSTLMFSISNGPDGDILLGTQKGLNKIHVEAPGKYHITTFDRYDGLPSNVIYDAIYHRDSIWVATPSGLVGFNQGQMPPHNYDPPIHFTSFAVNNTPTPLDSTLTFPHYQNHITVGFKGISYRHGGRLRYRYRIVGNEEEWSETDFPQVEFPQLAPGAYQFEVQPIRRDGQPGEHSASISFTIEKPFWATIWFKATFVLGCILLIVIVFRIRVLTYNRDVVREIFEILFRRFKPTAYLVVKSNGLTVRLAHPEILYLEAMGDYVRVVTEAEAHVVHSTMKKLSEELPSREFIRIHRSFLIRLDKVKAAKGKTALMIGETELPVGRTYKEKVAASLSSMLSQ